MNAVAPRRRRRALLIGLVCLSAALTMTAVTTSFAADKTPAAPPSSFHGVNWADPRDNYAADAVVPSGLNTTDDYKTVYRTTQTMVDGFRRTLGANTLRLPVNPASVGTTWWKSYRATIDAATDKGFKVILSYWESNAAKDGRVDDATAWKQMWNTVTAAYAHNPNVYFEPMNEPFGYTADEWVNVCTAWLAAHTKIPRSRVVISGTGYNDNVTAVGASPALAGTLLSLHFYGFWASYTTEAEWIANLLPRIGPYAYRTIIDEAGSPMTIGLNYGAHNGNVYTAYLAAITDIARGMGMGMVYWPGLRFNDSYSITSLSAKGQPQINSTSGVAQLRWGWGFGDTPPVNDQPAAPPGSQILGVGSNRCVDVPGFSTTDGTQLDLWDCNGGGNQSWDYTAAHELKIYASKCMQIGADGAAGAPVVIGECTGNATQHWNVNPDGSITSAANTALCLDASGAGTGNGTSVDVWYCNGAANQAWKLG